jgi:transcription antitermination factor NusA-like protein
LKTPICTFDAKTGTLCNQCDIKLKSGQLSQSDVDSSIILTKIAQKNNDINKMTLVGSWEIDNELVLIFKSSDIRILNSSPTLLDTIKKGFDKNVWIVENDSNDRRFLENLFYPVRIDNINFVWLPDGNKLTRVIISKKINGLKDETIKTISKISQSIRKIDLIVEME